MTAHAPYLQADRRRTRCPAHSAALAVLAALALIAALVGCAKATARRSQRVPIAVAFAQQRTVPYEIQATGTVEPTESASVTAQVGGLLTRVAFREGDEVRAGQVLFQVDPRRPELGEPAELAASEH